MRFGSVCCGFGSVSFASDGGKTRSLQGPEGKMFFFFDGKRSVNDVNCLFF